MGFFSAASWMANSWKCVAGRFWLSALRQAQAHLSPSGSKGKVVKCYFAFISNLWEQFNKSLRSIVSLGQEESQEASEGVQGQIFIQPLCVSVDLCWELQEKRLKGREGA